MSSFIDKNAKRHTHIENIQWDWEDDTHTEQHCRTWHHLIVIGCLWHVCSASQRAKHWASINIRHGCAFCIVVFDCVAITDRFWWFSLVELRAAFRYVVDLLCEWKLPKTSELWRENPAFIYILFLKKLENASIVVRGAVVGAFNYLFPRKLFKVFWLNTERFVVRCILLNRFLILLHHLFIILLDWLTRCLCLVRPNIVAENRNLFCSSIYCCNEWLARFFSIFCCVTITIVSLHCCIVAFKVGSLFVVPITIKWVKFDNLCSEVSFSGFGTLIISLRCGLARTKEMHGANDG